MAGALDKVFKEAAKAIVADLGDGLDTKIDYTRKFDGTYDTAKGTFTTFDRPYFNLKCPIEFIRSEEEEGRDEGSLSRGSLHDGWRPVRLPFQEDH